MSSFFILTKIQSQNVKHQTIILVKIKKETDLKEHSLNSFISK